MPKAASPKPIPVTARSRNLLRAEQEHRVRMVEELLSIVLAFARERGLSRAQCWRAWGSAHIHLGRERSDAPEAEGFATLMRIADLLAMWYREPAFLDKAGLPRALSPAGEGGFSSLSKRFLPQYEPADVMSMLIDERLLDRRPNGRVSPRRRAAAFATLNPMMLERLPVLVHGLVSTLSHNTHGKSRKSGTRCDRSTHLARLPVAQLPAFNAQVKRLAQVLLDNIDSWAQPRVLPAKNGAGLRTVNVGVEVFSFVDRSTPRPARKRSRWPE